MRLPEPSYETGLVAVAMLGAIATFVGMVALDFGVFLLGFFLLLLTGVGAVGAPFIRRRLATDDRR